MSAAASTTPNDSGTPGWGPLFWKAFECSSNPMVLLDAERRLLVAVNGAASRVFGYQNSDVAGRPPDDFIATNWRRVRESHWETLFRTGVVHGNRQVLNKNGDGVYVRFGATLETVEGRDLVLWVVHESALTVAGTRGVTAARTTPLTGRELEVVAGLAVGRRVREIAEHLVIAPATAQTHVRNAMEKLGARSQAHLVATAIATGMLDPDLADPGT